MTSGHRGKSRSCCPLPLAVGTLAGGIVFVTSWPPAPHFCNGRGSRNVDCRSASWARRLLGPRLRGAKLGTEDMTLITPVPFKAELTAWFHIPAAQRNSRNASPLPSAIPISATTVTVSIARRLTAPIGQPRLSCTRPSLGPSRSLEQWPGRCPRSPATPPPTPGCTGT